jgi:hypothetical protein
MYMDKNKTKIRSNCNSVICSAFLQLSGGSIPPQVPVSLPVIIITTTTLTAELTAPNAAGLRLLSHLAASSCTKRLSFLPPVFLLFSDGSQSIRLLLNNLLKVRHSHWLHLQKPMLRQTINSPLLWNPVVHHRIHKNSSVDPILSQMKPPHILAPSFLNIHSHISLPPTPAFCLFRLPDQHFVYTSCIFHTCYVPRPSTAVK